MKAKLKALVKKQKHEVPIRNDPDASLQIEKVRSHIHRITS